MVDNFEEVEALVSPYVEPSPRTLMKSPTLSVKKSLKELQKLYDPAEEVELDQTNNITLPGSFGG